MMSLPKNAEFSLRPTKNFYVPNGEEEAFKEQLEIPHYRNGPDPVMAVDYSRNPIEQQLLYLCLGARKLLTNSLKIENTSDMECDWNVSFSYEMLQGKSHEAACSVKQILEQNEFSSLDLIFFKVSAFLPKVNLDHEFQIVDVDGRKFIIDLSIRQFINSGLHLRNEEVAVFDALLKDGFVEVTEKSFEIYLKFFKSRCLFEQQKTYFKDEWALSSEPLSVNFLELLNR